MRWIVADAQAVSVPASRRLINQGGVLVRTVFFDAQQSLRNGWWLLIFAISFLITRQLYTPVVRALRALEVPGWSLELAPFFFVMLATWVCTRLRRESLASIGFRLDRRWFQQAGLGLLLGCLAIATITGLIWASGGVRFELDPARSASLLLQGLYLFITVALFEEALFRGFLFQRLVAGAGAWVAQLTLAALFAVGHWGNPGMEGSTQLWASIDLALGAIIFGLAYLRTGSLALPVGFHLGWNWMQGNVLGFGVSGIDQAGWLKPVFGNAPQWLSGGVFGPEASVFAVLIDLLVLVLLWRWQHRPIVREMPSAVAIAQPEPA